MVLVPFWSKQQQDILTFIYDVFIYKLWNISFFDGCREDFCFFLAISQLFCSQKFQTILFFSRMVKGAVAIKSRKRIECISVSTKYSIKQLYDVFI